jgi:hypothetical protein
MRLFLPLIMKFDTLVLQTFGRLAGVREFLELLDRALPESEWAENESLKAKAEQEEWEYNDFDVERQVIDERFRFWLPRYTSYSVVTLLYTVLEVQLGSAAQRAATQTTTSFQLSDVRGRGIESAVLYLARLGIYDVRNDPAWRVISDLRDLRHLIVHRAGTKGQSDDHRRTARRLAESYKGRIEFPDSDWSWYGEVWISIPLCREFIGTVEGLFDRLFDAMHMPPRYQRRHKTSTG